MARHNSVSAFAMVMQDPIIIKDKITGDFKKGHVSIILVRNKRNVGLGDENSLVYDNPILYSGNPEIIEQMSGLKMYDLIEVKGVLTTMDIKKKTTCDKCGEPNFQDGTMDFISPVYIDVRFTDMTEREALNELRKRMEISNQIMMIGNLCGDVAFYRNDKYKTSKYQIAVNRKYYLKDGQPNVRTDYPYVITYNEQAVKDYECLHTGSRILIDGRIQTREFKRQALCPHCQSNYEWNDRTIEVIPYDVEYLSDYTTPEEVERKKTEALEEARANLFKK